MAEGEGDVRWIPALTAESQGGQNHHESVQDGTGCFKCFEWLSNSSWLGNLIIFSHRWSAHYIVFLWVACIPSRLKIMRLPNQDELDSHSKQCKQPVPSCTLSWWFCLPYDASQDRSQLRSRDFIWIYHFVSQKTDSCNAILRVELHHLIGHILKHLFAFNESAVSLLSESYLFIR